MKKGWALGIASSAVFPGGCRRVAFHPGSGGAGGVAADTLAPDRELERELGAPLFDRAGRSVRLTSAGAAFRGHAVRALREVEMGRGAVADLLGLRAGTLRVGVTHSFSTALIPRAVAGFRREHPGVSVVVEKSSGRAIEQGLVSGTLDLGIAFAPPEDPEVAADTLFEEEIVLIVSPAHPLAGRASVRLAELDGLNMVLHGRGFATRRLLDDRMRDAGIRPRITVEMNDIDSLLEVVRLGTGATVLSRRAVNDPRGLVLVADHRPENEPDRRVALAPRLVPGRRLARVCRGRA